MISAAHAPDLESATSESAYVPGVITLHVRMGDCRVRVHFGVGRNFAVSVLLAITFIHRFLRAIFPAERKVVPYNSKPVLILILTTPTTKDDQEHNQHEHSILFMESDNVDSNKVPSGTTDKAVTNVPMHGTPKH